MIKIIKFNYDFDNLEEETVEEKNPQNKKLEYLVERLRKENTQLRVELAKKEETLKNVKHSLDTLVKTFL